ncbi:MAG: DUF3098 domain-containing protein [Bacteroidales bacterium OttesenSCG-928-I14]|jgi:hypothetical protein|nr:DUF3098 domain-containing protein [Bacteroidales bacterium OttesenSCG-928-I14]
MIEKLIFKKINFILLLISVVIIAVGFVIISGGKTSEETGFDQNIFNKRRLLIAPIILVSGFGLVIYSIIKKQK